METIRTPADYIYIKISWNQYQLSCNMDRIGLFIVVSVLASLASSTTPSCKADVKGSSNTFWQDDYNFDDTAQGLMDAMKASSIDDYLK